MKNPPKKITPQREHFSSDRQREALSDRQRDALSGGKIPYKKFTPRNMENIYQFLENKVFLERSRRAASIREGNFQNCSIEI